MHACHATSPRTGDGARVDLSASSPWTSRSIGWIVVGLIAGLFSGVVVGGRTARGWIPSLVIGVVSAVVVGWLLTSFARRGLGHEHLALALLAAGIATILRLLLKSFTFSD